MNLEVFKNHYNNEVTIRQAVEKIARDICERFETNNLYPVLLAWYEFMTYNIEENGPRGPEFVAKFFSPDYGDWSMPEVSFPVFYMQNDNYLEIEAAFIETSK